MRHSWCHVSGEGSDMKNNSRENETASNDSAVIHEPLSVSGWRAIALPHDHNDGTTHRWAVRYTKVGGPFDGVTVQIAGEKAGNLYDHQHVHANVDEGRSFVSSFVTEHDKL